MSDTNSSVLDPEVEDPHANGVSRRRMLRGSAAAGATAATAGCLGGDGGDSDGQPTVFVFNTGDKTLSVIDAADDELLTTTYLGSTASFPSNQYAPETANADGDALWLNVSDGVQAVSATSLSEQTRIDTGSEKNWQEVTPDGSQLVVSAREPAHTQYRIDADPESDGFGEVTAELDRSGEVDNEKGGPGPCDVTIGPDGTYAYVADIFSDTLTVLDVASFEIAAQADVPTGVDGADAARPWMGTATWDGEHLLVENNEGEHGTESVWDISDPTDPKEITRLTQDDDLGKLPLTSEVGPDNETGYVFTAGSEDVTVIDIASGEVETRIDLGGKAFAGTWGPSREKLYAPVQTADEVKVVDHADREVVATLSVGSKPYGATAATVRPESDSAANMMAALASLGMSFGGEATTYCLGNCHCGAGGHDHP